MCSHVLGAICNHMGYHTLPTISVMGVMVVVYVHEASVLKQCTS